MEARKLFYGFQRFLLILAVFLFALLENLRWKDEYNNLFLYFAYTFGGIDVEGGDSFLSLLFSVVPCVIVLYLFSQIMAGDFKINCVYVFTRFGKKSVWLNQKTGELFLKILLTYLLLFFMAFLLGVCSGLHPSTPTLTLIGAYLALLFCNVGTLFVFSYLQNVLSLRYGGARSFLYILIFYTGSLAGAFALYGKGKAANLLIPFLPASNQMYLWHEESTPFIGNISQNQLVGFRIIDSVIVLSAYAVAIYLIACRWLKKYDTLELMKEE